MPLGKYGKIIMRVIITGADGFIGSLVTNYFLNNGDEVLAIIHSYPLKRLHIAENLTIKTFDEILNINKNYYDVLINFAWKGTSGVDRCNINVQLANISQSCDFLEFAKTIGCKRFIGVGTIMEYEAVQSMKLQQYPINKNCVYGLAKYMTHGATFSNDGIEIIWTLITNTFGPGEQTPRLVNSTIRKLLNNETVTFSSCSQNYDFIYIDDLVKAFYFISKKGIPGREYVIGSGSPTQLKNYILKLIQIVNPSAKYFFGNDSGINLPLESFNTDNLFNDTGFVPSYSFEEGIKLTTEWIKNQ